MPPRYGLVWFALLLMACGEAQRPGVNPRDASGNEGSMADLLEVSIAPDSDRPMGDGAPAGDLPAPPEASTTTDAPLPMEDADVSPDVVSLPDVLPDGSPAPDAFPDGSPAPDGTASSDATFTPSDAEILCSVGLTRCGTFCIDTQFDPSNCGACGSTCMAGEACMAGRCVPGMDAGTPCKAPNVLCGMLCVDVRESATHCGACFRSCPLGSGCRSGACVSVSFDAGGGGMTCPPGRMPCGDTCRDVATDPMHCGACGRTCRGGEVCMAGACRAPGGDGGGPACIMPMVPCGSSCVDTASDPAHCGACGRACGPGQTCMAGACRAAEDAGGGCPPGRSACGGVCVDTQSDAMHCGVCGHACPSGWRCAMGVCAPMGCPSGQTLCAGTCVDTRSDRSHCGACGRACASGEACLGGLCMMCPPGQTGCLMSGGLGMCVDTRVDPLHCGACNRACPPATPTCAMGVCR